MMRPITELDPFIRECLAVYIGLRRLHFPSSAVNVFFNRDTGKVGIILQANNAQFRVEVKGNCRHVSMERFLGDWREYAEAIEKSCLTASDELTLWEQSDIRKRGDALCDALIKKGMLPS